MRSSETAYDLIKAFESLRLRSYLCPAKIWTVGWGSTRNVNSGTVISTDEAIGRLITDVTDAELELRKMLKVEVSQYEFDALVSWVFNLGATDAVKDSTLLRKLNAGEPGVSVEFLRWNRARVKGKLTVLNGLTRRRATERRLFDTGLLIIEP